MQKDILRSEIEDEWWGILNSFPPDEVVDDIVEIVKQDADYPNYNTDDIIFAIQDYLNALIRRYYE
jgi:hypothetical protein